MIWTSAFPEAIPSRSLLLFTGKISFAFTVVACLLAFFPRIAGRTYPLAFLILVGCKLAGLT